MPPSPTAYLYLHTHWDREWYQPFEVYRVRLVTVVRSVVDKLQSGELPNFLLDGQASLLEDVLAVDPALAKPISELMKKKLLAAGPWYVLADQMLVSGESLIRDLRLGLKITSQFGPPAMIGYCPDTFGHSVDLPRILQGFEIESAYVWRGVPKLDGGPLFLWQSPDGSRVLTYHLSRGYYNMLLHTGKDDALAKEQIGKWLAPQDSHFCKQINGALVPIGGDHVAPPENIQARLANLNAEPSRSSSKKSKSSDVALIAKAPAVVAMALPEFTRQVLGKIDWHSLPVLTSELRDNSAASIFERAFLLQGVLSSRLYLKRENRIAEHRLVSLSEPMHVQMALLNLASYPYLELEHAWKLLLKNHPHDSICGCSIDSVHREMQMRTVKFHQLLNCLDADLAGTVASPVPAANTAPSFAAVGTLPIVDPKYAPERVALFNLSTEALVSPVPFVWATEEDSETETILEDPERRDVQIIASEKRAEVFAGPGSEPIVKTVNVHHGWLWADKLPAFGSRIVNFRQIPAHKPESKSATKAKKIKIKLHRDLVTAENRRVSNEFLSCEVEPDGTLIVISHETRRRSRAFRLGHTFRDVADCGDSYNFDPLPGDVALVAKVTGVKTGLKGPLVASLLISYELKIPLKTEELTKPRSAQEVPENPSVFARSNKTVAHRFTTEVSLRRGVPLVFFDTEWENKSSDHRLEVLIDTGLEVENTFAENHFSMVRRTRPHLKIGLPVGNGTEAPLDRLACQRFFIANGQVFFNAGLPEYGVDGSSVAITILRAFSLLSRPRLQTRGNGAGPSLPTAEGNSLALNRASYGWAPLLDLTSEEAKGSTNRPHRQAPDILSNGDTIQAYKLAELFEGRFWGACAHGDHLPADKSLIAVDNPALRLVSAYMDQDGGSVIVRLLNVTQAPQDAAVHLRFALRSAFSCKLNEQEVDKLPLQKTDQSGQSRLSLSAGPNQLMTLKLLLSR